MTNEVIKTINSDNGVSFDVIGELLVGDVCDVYCDNDHVGRIRRDADNDGRPIRYVDMTTSHATEIANFETEDDARAFATAYARADNDDDAVDIINDAQCGAYDSARRLRATTPTIRSAVYEGKIGDVQFAVAFNPIVSMMQDDESIVAYVARVVADGVKINGHDKRIKIVVLNCPNADGATALRVMRQSIGALAHDNSVREFAFAA